MNNFKQKVLKIVSKKQSILKKEGVIIKS